MPIIPVECPNCRRSIKVDSTKDAAICEFCKQPYIVKDAVFQTYVNSMTGGSADTTSVHAEKDFEITARELVSYYGKSDRVQIPPSVKIIGDGVFASKPIVSVEIPDSVTKIAGFAFQNCSSLKEIAIPDSVTEIGEYAFYGCSSLQKITIPDSVPEIGSFAFWNCSSLQKVTMPNYVTKIGWRAFEYCSSLQDIKIPSCVTRIESEAFRGCSSLKEIVIPGSVTFIGWGAFQACSSLQTVTFEGEAPTFGRDDDNVFDAVFYGCSSLQTVTFGGGEPPMNDIRRAFEDTPYLSQYLRLKWQEMGVCQHCGGTFRFGRCRACRKPKDY